MLGVVLWASEARQGAVIWCEDHGDIAYLRGAESLRDPLRWPVAGDLVSVELSQAGSVRLARNVALLQEEWGACLPQALLTVAAGAAEAAEGEAADVVSGNPVAGNPVVPHPGALRIGAQPGHIPQQQARAPLPTAATAPSAVAPAPRTVLSAPVSKAPAPDERVPYLPEAPAFPPGPFAPVQAGQGMMPPDRMPAPEVAACVQGAAQVTQLRALTNEDRAAAQTRRHRIAPV